MTRTPVPTPSGTSTSGQRTLSVLVYSSSVDTRAAVRLAVGRRPAADVPPVEWIECATAPAVLERVAAGGIDLVVLDGEASPAGGMGVCRQLKDELASCPPVLLLIARPDDVWLATWSMADHVVPYPLDPVVVAGAVAELARELRARAASAAPAGKAATARTRKGVGTGPRAPGAGPRASGTGTRAAGGTTTKRSDGRTGTR